MLKLTIEIKENKNKDSCSVTIVNPKDLSKSSEVEKQCGAMVRNEIEKAIKNIEN